MGGAAGSASLVHAHCAEKATACRLLRDIATRPAAKPLQCVDKPLILYGAGNLGRMAKEYFSHIGVAFKYVVDSNPSAYCNDPAWQGIPVIGSLDVPEEDKKTSLLVVCISTIPYAPVYQSLIAQGWVQVEPFYDITDVYRERHPLSNGWFSGQLDERAIVGIESVLERWEDNESRCHHLQFIAWRFLREEWTFADAPVTTSDRFFIKQIASVLNDNEVLLDIGAYHGNTTTKFLHEVDNKFRNIWVVEPDDVNLAVLCQKLKLLPPEIFEKIHILQTAVGACAGEGAFFNGLGYASQLSQLGPHKVTVQTIDEIDIKPTFIKLHLEGAELEALKGATKTIIAHRPIIVATSYHNSLGLWEFPQWLMEITGGYKFYMRLHGWCGTNAVIYCIPSERSNKLC